MACAACSVFSETARDLSAFLSYRIAARPGSSNRERMRLMTDGLPQLSDVLRRLGQELTRRSVGVELRWVGWGGWSVVGGPSPLLPSSSVRRRVRQVLGRLQRRGNNLGAGVQSPASM